MRHKYASNCHDLQCAEGSGVAGMAEDSWMKMDEARQSIRTDDRPRLRPVEVFPVDTPQGRMVCVRDMQQLTDGMLVLSPVALLILQMLDGGHTVAEVQAAMVRRAGGDIRAGSAVRELLEALDEHLFLDNERFAQHQQQLRDEYAQAEVRPASHAGAAYPADPGELRAMLNSFFAHEDGPGAVTAGETSAPPVRAIIAPHIDLRRGGPCYAWAYANLRRQPRADRYVVLGIAHTGARYPAVLSQRPFETPLGVTAMDEAFCKSLLARCGPALVEDEYCHRAEHSVEFQVVFLQHLFGGDVPVVALLCGGFETADGASPMEDENGRQFINALRDALAEAPGESVVVASVDLSHMGSRFGDSDRVNEEFLQRLRERDLELLSPVTDLDAEAYYRMTMADGNPQRIDAVPAVYTMLHAAPLQTGRLLWYDQSVEPEFNSVVSFAGLEFS